MTHEIVVVDLPNNQGQVAVHRWDDREETTTFEVDYRDSVNTRVRWVPVRIAGGEYRVEVT